ncbi:hypothetical protein BU15DRAFT_33320, partial [Melanogaster broomeanus]
IAKKYSLHRTTIKRIFERYAKSEDFHHITQKPGRQRLFTSHDTRYAVRALARGDTHDISNLQRKFFPGISAETIRNRLRECGL